MLRLVLLAAMLVLGGCRRQPSAKVFVDPALAILVPPDTIMLAGARVQQIQATPFYQRFVTARKLEILERLRKNTGIEVNRHIWELLFASDGKDAVALIRGEFAERGREPRLDVPGAQRMTYKGHLMLGNEQAAVLFLNPSTAAAGRTAALRGMIDRKDQASGIPATLKKTIALLPADNQLWFVANTEAGTPLAGPLSQLIGRVQRAWGGADVRQAFRANVRLEAPSEADAEQLRSAVRGLVGMLRLKTPEDHRELLHLYDGVQVAREGRQALVSIDWPFDVLEKSAAEIPTFGVK